jgi:catechol 2,3-dioxygenase-like lactoylglutathione lyase family enzyme
MSNTPRFTFALEYVSDIPATRRFYVDVLGLTVQREAPNFVQFGTFAIASDESMDGTNRPELWWEVDDAEAAFRHLSASAEISMPPRKMPFGTCFGVKDPAGQVHYLLEFVQTRPSQEVASAG